MLCAAKEAIDKPDLGGEKLRPSQCLVNAADGDECIFPVIGVKVPQAERVHKIGERINKRAVVQSDVRLEFVELRAADGSLVFACGLPGGDDAAGVADNLGILLGVRLAQFDESGVRCLLYTSPSPRDRG